MSSVHDRLQYQVSAIAAILVMVGVDLFTSLNTGTSMGFLSLGAIPYVLALVAATLFGGALVGVISGALVVVLLVLVIPFFTPELSMISGPHALSTEQRIGLLVTVVSGALVMYHISTVRDRAQTVETDSQKHTEENVRLQAENQATEQSLRQMYNRLAVEARSIASLGEQLPRLQSLNRNEVLEAMLVSARLLTGATSVVIYRLEDASLNLIRERVWPLRDQPRYPVTLPMTRSIEGWVVRNVAPFTLRFLMEDPDLAAIDQGRTVISVPIMTRGRVWGVLTIGELPLLDYNQTAEAGAQVVAALGGSGIEESLGIDDSEAGVPVADLESASMPVAPSAPVPESEHTPAPEQTRESAEGPTSEQVPAGPIRPAGGLRTDLEGWLSGESRRVSLFIAELRGPRRSPLPLSDEQHEELVDAIGERLHQLTGGAARLYRYQWANQFALVGLNLDFDAAPYFLLRILETIGSRAWTVGSETVFPEPLVGFSSDHDGDAPAMIHAAERMLAAQTIMPEEA